MFGDDILATAVTQPCDTITGLAGREIWFPAGDWYDFATGMMYSGERTVELEYVLAENPWFAKAGSIIPMNPSDIGSLQEECNTLVLTFVPGADGSLRHYEDDGISQDYKEGGAWTEVSKKTDGRNVTIRIGARKGSYKGAPQGRSYELRLPAMFPPEKVTVCGAVLKYERFPEGECWTYDPYSLSPIIYIGEKSCGEDLLVEIELSQAGVDNQESLYGLAGVFKRCVELTAQFKFEQGKKDAYLMLPVEYLKVAQCPNRILEYPEQISVSLSEYAENLKIFLEKIDDMDMIGEAFKEKLKRQLTIVK
jgi:alpha-glucosidase